VSGTVEAARLFPLEPPPAKAAEKIAAVNVSTKKNRFIDNLHNYREKIIMVRRYSLNLYLA
jgi:hypothetical protein